MNKRTTAIILFLSAVFAAVISLNSSSINNTNRVLRVQTRKTDAVVCQLNAIRNHLFKVDDMKYHFSDIIDASIPSIVVVRSYNASGKLRTNGAGFIINADKGYVITAKHVVDTKHEKVVKVNNRNIEVLDIYSDKENDFAILILDVNDANYCDITQLQLSNNTPRRGEFIIAIGHPWIFEYSTSIGIVSNPNSKHMNYKAEGNKNAPRIQFDAAINPGNSGGAIINWYGDVVGLVVSIHYGNGGQHNAGVNFAIPASEMKKCLTRFDKWLADKEFQATLKEALIIN